MKKLQLLFVCLFASNFVWASQESQYKSMIQQMVQGIIADSNSAPDNDGFLYNLEQRNVLLSLSSNPNGGLEMDINAEWSVLDPSWKIMGANMRLMQNLGYDLATVKTVEERDACIDKAVINMETCMRAIERGKPMPACLRLKK